MKKTITMQCYNLIYYKPKLWEIVLLAFLLLYVHTAPGATVWYKKFYNRLYICGYIRAETDGSCMAETDSPESNAGNN